MIVKRAIKRGRAIYTIISIVILTLLVIIFIKTNKGHYLSSLYDLIKLKCIEVVNLFKAI
jgi:hypothetical protein